MPFDRFILLPPFLSLMSLIAVGSLLVNGVRIPFCAIFENLSLSENPPKKIKTSISNRKANESDLLYTIGFKEDRVFFNPVSLAFKSSEKALTLPTNPAGLWERFQDRMIQSA